MPFLETLQLVYLLPSHRLIFFFWLFQIQFQQLCKRIEALLFLCFIWAFSCVNFRRIFLEHGFYLCPNEKVGWLIVFSILGYSCIEPFNLIFLDGLTEGVGLLLSEFKEPLEELGIGVSEYQRTFSPWLLGLFGILRRGSRKIVWVSLENFRKLHDAEYYE